MVKVSAQFKAVENMARMNEEEERAPCMGDVKVKVSVLHDRRSDGAIQLDWYSLGSNVNDLRPLVHKEALSV